jgi:hypothetical protein
LIPTHYKAFGAHHYDPKLCSNGGAFSNPCR